MRTKRAKNDQILPECFSNGTSSPNVLLLSSAAQYPVKTNKNVVTPKLGKKLKETVFLF